MNLSTLGALGSKDRQPADETLVVGGTGKTGRRVAQRLAARGVPVRVGSRSGTPPFDWEDSTTWAPAMKDVAAAYITYYRTSLFPELSTRCGASPSWPCKAGCAG